MDNEPLLPPGEPVQPIHENEVAAAFGNKPPAPPSIKRQSWGALISIIIIVLMIIIGAFYSWGKRIADERALTASTTEQ